MPSKWRISAQKYTPRDQQQPMSVDVDIPFCQFLWKNIVNKMLSWIQFNPDWFQIHNGGYELSNWKITLSRAQWVHPSQVLLRPKILSPKSSINIIYMLWSLILTCTYVYLHSFYLWCSHCKTNTKWNTLILLDFTIRFIIPTNRIT